jgi:hypothetical protein
MFNILNKEIRGGKNSPMVRKILHSLSAFSHGILGALARLSYLLEPIDLRDCTSLPVGLRIAFLVHQPASVRIRTGKD